MQDKYKEMFEVTLFCQSITNNYPKFCLLRFA